jgi:hypothetical protein
LGGGSILATAAIGTHRRTEDSVCLGTIGGRVEDLAKLASNTPRCVFVGADDHDINASFVPHFASGAGGRVGSVTIHPDCDIGRISLPELPRHAVAIWRRRRWRRIQTERSSTGGHRNLELAGPHCILVAVIHTSTTGGEYRYPCVGLEVEQLDVGLVVLRIANGLGREPGRG